MMPALELNSGDAAPDPYHDLKEELRKIDVRLCVMIDKYENEPTMIDRAVMTPKANPVNVESVIKAAYRLMKKCVYAENAPLRTDHEVCQAFEDQRDEFDRFYRSALGPLNTLKNIIKYCDPLKAEPPSYAQVKAVREAEKQLEDQREECIVAVIHFRRKFSGMIAGL
jgi:hypothetical protein